MTEALVEVVRLPHAEGLALPAYASAGAAALDLLAAVAEPLVLAPGGRAALNQGVLVANAPGTIDEDYRGEIKVILMNGGTEPVVVTRGMRIAQAVLAPVTRIVWREVSTLDETVRGVGGFGSTGV